jgi:hypothetical protein
MLTVPTFDTANFLAVAGAVLVASAVFWAVRKAIALVG